MSDAGSEKPYDATPSRIAKAKRDGNTARSQEFGATLSFAAAAVGVIAIASPMGSLAGAAMRYAAQGVVPRAQAVDLLAFALVPALAASCAGVFAGLVQNGGPSFVAVVPKFERLKPTESLKRMLSRESATQAVRAAVAFGIAATSIVPSMRDLFGTLAGNDPPQRVAALAWSGAIHVVFAAAAVGGVFAFAEYALARRAWLQKLKMSYDELKRERKEHDGDPATRGRRRTMHRNLVRGAVARVKDAAFVVVNPTHVAIALDYRPPQVPVPLVLVRAAGEGALRVRALARRYGIPVIENVALARMLYRDAQAGAAIPHAHYVAVAEIVVALVRSGVLENQS